MPILNPNEIFANRYRLIRNIGTGGYSEVWLAADQMAGDLEIALKVYAPGQGLDDQAIQIFRDEYKCVFYLNHPNLLKPTHFDIFDGRPYLILPYCSKGSIMKMTGKIDEASIAKMFIQIGGALEYLHNQEPPVIHRDIKPENILVDDADNYYLCDFGISSKLRRTLTKSMGRGKESSGTVAFMAPELFQAKRHILPQSDVFSFGVMIYELITDELPFGQIGGAMLMNGAEVPDISDFCNKDLSLLISKCLALNPNNRPTSADLKNIGESYLRNKKWKFNEKNERKTEIQAIKQIKNNEDNNQIQIKIDKTKIQLFINRIISNLLNLPKKISQVLSSQLSVDKQKIKFGLEKMIAILLGILSFKFYDIWIFESNMTFFKGLVSFILGFSLGEILIYLFKECKGNLVTHSNYSSNLNDKNIVYIGWILIAIGLLLSMSIKDLFEPYFNIYYYSYWNLLFLSLTLFGGTLIFLNFIKNTSIDNKNDDINTNNSKKYLNFFILFLGFGFIQVASWQLTIIIQESILANDIFTSFNQENVTFKSELLLLLIIAISSLIYSLYFKIFFNTKKIFFIFFIIFFLFDFFIHVLNNTIFYYVNIGIIDSSFWSYSVYFIKELFICLFIMGLFLFLNKFDFKNAIKKYLTFFVLLILALSVHAWILWENNTNWKLGGFLYPISNILDYALIGFMAVVSLKSFGGLKKLIPNNKTESDENIINSSNHFRKNKKLYFILIGIIAGVSLILFLFWQINNNNTIIDSEKKSIGTSEKIKIENENENVEKKYNQSFDKYHQSISAFNLAEQNETNDYSEAVNLLIESTNILVDVYEKLSEDKKASALERINKNKAEIEKRISDEQLGREYCPTSDCKALYDKKINQLKDYENIAKAVSNYSTTNESTNKVEKLKIGDNFAGGIIFYLDNTGKHGKVCAPSDQSTRATWNEAKRICSNLTLNEYSDWYLPNKNELNQIYVNLHRKNMGGFARNYYWSSSESNAINAWSQRFTNGYQDSGDKNFNSYVRAVRAF